MISTGVKNGQQTQARDSPLGLPGRPLALLPSDGDDAIRECKRGLVCKCITPAQPLLSFELMTLADDLHQAIEADDADRVRCVVTRGLQRSESYNTLYEMYEPGHPRECGPNGDWALDRAVHQNNATIAAELFRAGANANTSAPDEYPKQWPDCPPHWVRSGDDLVQIVAFAGNAALLAAFLAAGADLEVAVVDGIVDLEPEDAMDACRRLFGALPPDAAAQVARQIHTTKGQRSWRAFDDYHDLRALLHTTMRPEPLPLSSVASLLCVYAVIKFGEAAKRARTRVAAAALLAAEQEKWIRGLSKSQRKKARIRAMTAEERAEYNRQRRKSKAGMREHKRIRAMTAEERAEYNRQRRKSKAGMREHHQPVEAGEDEDAQECIKCGFRTHLDWCPECGRPTE